MAAYNQGPYPTKPGYEIAVPPPPASPNAGAGPSLQSANWIWSDANSASSAPVGNRAFRKRINLPNGNLVNSAVIILAADNEYTLYVNGLVVGSGTDFSTAQRFVVNFPPTSTVVIAVFGRNTGGPAGLIAAVKLVSCDCAEDDYFVTDGGWKYSNSVSDGFPSLGYNDAGWDPAIVQGKYGMAPWGQTKIPTKNSPQSAALPGAPPAAPASVVA
ncbi:hypothetical protein BDZ94DRAFT_1262243 [Collybia nuda]|uniref:Lectin n=1 Tax=Collybia nuda TaxID=64659 RepID=A0A9P6CH89_9AGAR|nr:hypothetical protein BDZ94DRAFT_1262243 [Collybia nuda]